MVRRMKKLDRAPAKNLGGLPHTYDAFHPCEDGMLRPPLRLHVHRWIAVQRIQDERGIKALGIGSGKTRVPTAVPLHGSAHSVPITEKHVVSHTDRVSIIHYMSCRNARQRASQQLDLAAVEF